MKKVLPFLVIIFLSLLAWLSMYLFSSFEGIVFNPRGQLGALSGAGSGLIAHYTFDDTTNDVSGNGNHAVIQNGAHYVDGKIGKAVNFPQANSRVLTPGDLVGTGSATVCAWFYARTAPFYSQPFSNSKFAVWVSSLNRFSVTSDGKNGPLTGENAVTINTWKHLCVTRGNDANGASTIYIDGVVVGGGNTGVPTAGTQFSIGNDPWGNQVWDGYLDDVRIYNRILSGAEVQALAGSNATSNPTAPSPAPNNPPAQVNTPGCTGSSNRICKAASGRPGDVQTALNEAKDGDTVIIPAGVWTWDQAVSLDASKRSISLKGEGKDKTIITLTVPTWALQIVGAKGESFTVSDMELIGGPGGTFALYGDSESWRVHDIKFTNPNPQHHIIFSINGPTYGLIDSNYISGNSYPEQFVNVTGGNWNVWKQPFSFGSKEAVYIEDNTFVYAGHADPHVIIDGQRGGKAVVRYNKVTNHGVNIGTHGFDSGGGASMLLTEVYGNEFITTDFPNGTLSSLSMTRGGTNIFFNNHWIIGSQVWTNPYISLRYFRNDMNTWWGKCDGTRQYKMCSNIDKNWNIVPGGGDFPKTALTDADCPAGFTAKWKFCSVSKMNLCTVDSDCPSSETCSAYLDGPAADGELRCFMQPGMGSQNKSEPAYEWNNIVSTPNNLPSASIRGVTNVNYVSGWPVIANRDYFNDTCKPGYRPYTYPHPLRGLSAKSQPLNCPGTPVQPVPSTPSVPDPVVSSDGDNDGVVNASDKCPQTPSSLRTSVNKHGCAKPKDTKFDIKPNFENIDLEAVNNLELGKSNVGKIRWTGTVDVEREDTAMDFDSYIDIQRGKVTLNSGALPELNKPATITLYNITVKNPQFLRDGAICTGCQLVSYSNNTLVFTVPGFSTYEIIEGGSGSTPPASSSSSGGSSRSGSSSRSQVICPKGSVYSPTTGKRCTTFTNYSFKRDLTLGSKGEDVRQLQQYLNNNGFPIATSGDGSKGRETTYFGPATQRALIKFQQAKKITPAAGYFGSKSRLYIQTH